MAVQQQPAGQPNGWPAAFLGGDGEKFLRELIAAACIACPATVDNPDASTQMAAAVLDANCLASTMQAWAARRIPAGRRVRREELISQIGADVAALDTLLGRQVDAVLHDPRFQQLEGSWRALKWLVKEAAEASQECGVRKSVRVRFISASKREIRRDISSALEFDQSALWRKVYEDEFGTPGGAPYGLLVADFEIGERSEDVELLTSLSEIAAASFAPLLLTPSLDLLGVDSIGHSFVLQQIDSLRTAPEFVKWRALREREESRFIGLPLPHIIGRLPYDGWFNISSSAAQHEQTWSQRSFRYSECVDGPGGGQHLWISGAWALAAVIMREFGRRGWFAEIQGASRDEQGGGMLPDLPTETFPAFARSGTYRGPTRTYIDQISEAALEQAGFIPLCTSSVDGQAAFYSGHTLHKPEKFNRANATANARISSMLRYILCASRIAHYIKVIARNKIGLSSDAALVERFLNTWVSSYVSPDDQAAPDVQARLPLRAAQVQVRPEPGAPGTFKVIMHLQPHFQITHVGASLTFSTTLRRRRGL
jgi:type VI secretion system protein ImpD